jgi:hypothetical protein
MEGVMSRVDTMDLIAERVLSFMQEEGPSDRYPHRTHFIAADGPEHGKIASAAMAEGDPVVLVFPGGNEVLIQPGENGTPAQVLARDSSGQQIAA